MVKAAQEIGNVAQAIEETITTPTPGLGHSKIGDIAALITMALGFIGVL